jgi:putative DNA primase/helicase
MDNTTTTDTDFTAAFDERQWEPDYAPEYATNVVALPGAKPTEVSEDQIALAFTRDYADTMKFDHDIGAWFQWSRSYWQKLSVPVAFDYCRISARRMSAGKAVLCKSSTAAGAERFARADPAHAVTATYWDSDPMLLGTPSGTIDLRLGRRREPDPNEGITKITGCSPAHGEPSRWLQFLRESTGGDDEMIYYLQRVCGYCLTGRTGEHALVFIHGPGGNGKGVFMNIFTYVLGDYAVTAPMDTFTAQKFAGHPTDLALLKGARLVTASETERGRAWAESRIKAITGGDPITARFMRQDFFTYQPQFKLMIFGNFAPRLNNVDDAMRRRFNIIPFTNKPARPDRDLERQLREEAPRILAWMIHGCRRWLAEGLARPASVSAATNSYFDEQDLFGQWMADRCRVEPENEHLSSPSSQLFNSWKQYANEAGQPDMVGTTADFAESMEKRGLRRFRTTHMRGFKGVELLNSNREME